MKLFDMLTNEDLKRIKKEQDLAERVKELETSLSTALDINDELLKDNLKIKKRAEEAEGEVTIVKGIGQNSPEIKSLQEEVEELKAELARAKEEHQYDNLVHQNELEKLLKK